MSLNETVSAERVHIGFFGLRNAGKSSVVNAVTGQQLALVSDVKGTTTDPVKKAMELLPLGPVVIIDTPGIDDEGELGGMRVRRAYQVLNYADIAVVVIDAARGETDLDRELVEKIKAKNIPYIKVYNKAELVTDASGALQEDSVRVSAATGFNIDLLRQRIAALAKKQENTKRIVGDLIGKGDTVVLVTPIDASAPKGRLILPQQQTIRDILDSDATALVTKETTLKSALASLEAPPRLVITDSQAFGTVAGIVPENIPLTSFSILFMRYKGSLEQAAQGAKKLDSLKDGDRVLISEGCTHHRQCEDIGTVKMPKWIKEYTKKDIRFEFTSGGEFPEDLSKYALVVHCGGCMLNEREMKYRINSASDHHIPITNYGIAIAKMNGILERSVASLDI